MKIFRIITILCLFFSSHSFAMEERPTPMKIALFVGMTNLPHDTSNVNCQSNIISRNVPATYANVKTEVDKLKVKFFEACERQSGRKVYSESNYQWMSNEYGDRKLQERRIFKNDIVVTLK